MGNLDVNSVHEIMRNARKVVYTAIFGNYDDIEAVSSEWDCDFICFTDNPALLSEGWVMRSLGPSDEDPALRNRRYKMLAHRYLEEYDWSLYVDGNIRITADPSVLFYKYLRTNSIALPTHRERTCIYEEAVQCVKSGLTDQYVTEKQIERYIAAGFPENMGLTENGLILRAHKDPVVIELMEAWWREYCSGARRDQLSLPYLVWKNRIAVANLTEGPRVSGDFFQILLHSSDKRLSVWRRGVRNIISKKHLATRYRIAAKLITILVYIRARLAHMLKNS